MFLWSWIDLLKLLAGQSKRDFSGEGDKDKHKVKVCFFLRLPNSYDHKRSHNGKVANATYFKPDRGEDNNAGFAFVREDGAVLLVCPRLG